MADRIGRQTPTTSVILPHDSSLGEQAIKLYSLTGNELFEWQKMLLCDIMGRTGSNWTHNRFGISVSRRNGKTEIVTAREFWGLLKGERIMHTAHHTATTHSSWEHMIDLLEKAGVKYTSIRATGRERIQIPMSGGRIEYRSRTAKTGLGEGYDLLVIDEAQEYTDDQESALKYMVTSSKDPQTIMCGTPPTASSVGTVFKNLRTATLEGSTENAGWAEWSVDDLSDPEDRDLWYETNPSLGIIFTERNVAAEISGDNIDFNIQRYGLWLKYEQKSAITEAEWNTLRVDELPPFRGGLFIGVKFAKSGETVSMSIAVKTTDQRIFVEGIDCRPITAGNQWIKSFIAASKPAAVVIDGAGAQNVLAAELKADGVRPAAILPKVQEVVTAYSLFEKALIDRSICHKGQPSMVGIVSHCEKRAIGSNGGFGYKSMDEDHDISLMDSMVLAHWICSTKREVKKQVINY